MAFRVSIVIRNHNYGRYLRDAVDSALAQTYPLTEVVAVDDGSTDDSRSILAVYGDRIVTVFQDNGGEASALNAGFRAAGGEIVLFLDSDDVLAPDAAAAIAALWDADVTRAHFPLYAMNADGILSRQTHPSFQVPDMTMEEHLAILGQVISGAQSCNAYAAWALRRILPMDEKMWFRTCDCYLNALTMAQGRTRLIHAPMGGYRFHDNNLTLRNSLEISVRDRAVMFHPNLHDAVRSFVGNAAWSRIKPSLPPYHWLHRFLSYRLNPQHPFANDTFAALIATTARAVIRKPNASVWRRSFLVGGLFAAGTMPTALLRRSLPWMLRVARTTSIPKAGHREPARHWRRFYAVPSTAE